MSYKSLLSLLAMVFTMAINPMVLQGCFLRCPPIKPYDWIPHRKTTAENLERTFTFVSDEGSLELQLAQVSLMPVRKRYAVHQSRVGWFIADALAMPSCQRRESPPDRYRVSVYGKLIWRPNSGDARVLVEKVLLNGIMDNHAAVGGNGSIELAERSRSFNATVRFVRGQQRSPLDSSVWTIIVGEEQWLIRTEQQSITQRKVAPTS